MKIDYKIIWRHIDELYHSEEYDLNRCVRIRNYGINLSFTRHRKYLDTSTSTSWSRLDHYTVELFTSTDDDRRHFIGVNGDIGFRLDRTGNVSNIIVSGVPYYRCSESEKNIYSNFMTGMCRDLKLKELGI